MAAETGQFDSQFNIGTSVFALLFPDLHSAFALAMPAGLLADTWLCGFQSVKISAGDIAGWRIYTIPSVDIVTFATIGSILLGF